LAEQYLVKRGPGIDFSDFILNQKRFPGMEFVGKRSEGIIESYNLPVLDTEGGGAMEKRAPGMEFAGDFSVLLWSKTEVLFFCLGLGPS
jgi:hypothetical protein